MHARSRKLAFFVLVSLLGLILSACSQSNNAAISVNLYYPQETTAAAPAGGPAAETPRPLYSQVSTNRILIRVLAPHIATPREEWFDRSEGRGEISGIPPGTRIAVEVDEYDNTAGTLTLLGRGWYQGITLSAGQYRTVPVAMYDKGTIVRVCGAPPASGNGTAGDTGDGGLADNALLGNPLAVKVGSGDEVFVSSSQYNRIRKIDRYGYISQYAGNGPPGTLNDGQSAATAPIGAAYDMDIGPYGDLFLITWDQLIVKIDRTTGNISVKYNLPRGVGYNPAAKPDLAVASDNEIYYTNGIDAKVYLVQDNVLSNYVWDDGTAPSTADGALKNTYPLNYPASITFNPAIPNLYFADLNNNRIKSMTMGTTGRIYTKVGGGTSAFSEGIDSLLVTLALPYFCEYVITDNNFYFRERDFHRVRVVRPGNLTYTLAGSGTANAGYSGDGFAATSAALNNPSAVAVDSRGNVYIADSGNHALRVVIGGALP